MKTVLDERRIKEGTLAKKSSKGIKGIRHWNSHRFVVTPKWLAYYRKSKKETPIPQQEIPTRLVLFSDLLHTHISLCKNSTVRFNIRTARYQLELRAKSECLALGILSFFLLGMWWGENRCNPRSSSISCLRYWRSP